MSAPFIAALCTIVSALGILGLVVSDPKRRRGQARRVPSLLRGTLALLCLLPGVWLAVTVQGAAFLLWIGASAILGWIAAALANRFAVTRAQ